MEDCNLTDLSVPDVDTFVKGPAGKVPAIRAEGHAVDRLLVAGQCVYTNSTLHVPQTHRWVKWCTEERQREAEWALTHMKLLWFTHNRLVIVSPGQHEVGAGVVGPGACRAPLNGVDFFAVGLEVVDTCVLLHTPDLLESSNTFQKSQTRLRYSPKPHLYVAWTDLECHVIRAGGQQAASGIPLDGVHLILQQIRSGRYMSRIWLHFRNVTTDQHHLSLSNRVYIYISPVDSSSFSFLWESSAHTGLTVCPWKVFTGLSWPSLHTWMHMSVLQEANVLLLCQSTSRAGAEGRHRQSLGLQQWGVETEHEDDGLNCLPSHWMKIITRTIICVETVKKNLSSLLLTNKTMSTLRARSLGQRFLQQWKVEFIYNYYTLCLENMNDFLLPTWVERKLLLRLSRVCIPNNRGLYDGDIHHYTK